MKKILIILFVFGLGLSLTAQEDYRMYQMVYITPMKGHVKDFEEKLAEHNQKFHTEGAMRVNIDVVTIGEHMGKYVWVQGPMTFADFDALPEDEAHEKHWDEEVMPYVKSIEEAEFWRINDKKTYMPEGFEGADKVIITFFDLVRGKEKLFMEVLDKVKEVHEKNEYEEPFIVLNTKFQTGNGRDIAIASFFKDFASFDNDDKFLKDFEEINGPGSWGDFISDFLESTLSSKDEIRIMRKDLGGAGE